MGNSVNINAPLLHRTIAGVSRTDWPDNATAIGNTVALSSSATSDHHPTIYHFYRPAYLSRFPPLAVARSFVWKLFLPATRFLSFVNSACSEQATSNGHLTAVGRFARFFLHLLVRKRPFVVGPSASI